MAGNEGMVRIEPSSALYQEFARLYRIAQELRPGGGDRWNGELYARTDDKWGGLAPDGTMRLNQDLVLDHLTGGARSDDPERQAQALATVLHESKHARTEIDAQNEPNAVRRRESFGLNEGLVELATMEDFAEFAQRAGYDGLPQPEAEYPGAVLASNELLTRATTSEQQRTELLHSAVDQPVVMGWDVVADHIVRNELAEVVPQDAVHQQAARAHLVNQMAVGEWDGVQNRPGRGPLTADLAKAGVDRAVGQIREHYGRNPGEPYPAKVPNPAAALSTEVNKAGEQQRHLATEQSRSMDRTSPVDLSRLPPPTAGTRVDHAPPAGTQAAPAAGNGQAQAMRFLSGQAPAAQATHQRPSLGQGARGAGAPAGAGAARTGADKGPTPTGRDER